jgi:TolB-like protein/DNA-binding winged helix-turn-helix (wHTH) protein
MADHLPQNRLEQTESRKRIARFGPYEADFGLKVLRKSGVKIKLQEQPFRLLGILVEREGAILTREELRKALWPADVFVRFDAGLNTAFNKLRRALGDEPDRPVFVETVPRSGYRFVAPVAWAELPDSEEVSSQLRIPINRSSSEKDRQTIRSSAWNAFGWKHAATFLLACTVMTIGAFILMRTVQSQTAAPQQKKIVVLVLPFDNLSADQSEKYVSDGLTEEVITQIEGRYARCLRVLAKTSAAQLKASHMPFDQMAREFGVSYIVAGGIRRSGQRIRITAQLVHAPDQMSVWANTYDEEAPPDLIAVQSDVASQIAESLALEIVPYARLSDRLMFWQNASTGHLSNTYVKSDVAATSPKSFLPSSSELPLEMRNPRLFSN